MFIGSGEAEGDAEGICMPGMFGIVGVGDGEAAGVGVGVAAGIP